jgi:hypothetical protein
VALIKEDVGQLLVELESFGKVEKAVLDGPISTNDE